MLQIPTGRVENSLRCPRGASTASVANPEVSATGREGRFAPVATSAMSATFNPSPPVPHNSDLPISPAVV